MIISNYNFEGPYSLSELEVIQNVSGVYVIICDNILTKTPMDVGESGELRERLKNHERLKCWRDHCKGGSVQVFVHYTKGMREDERKKIEQRIRSSYKLPCGER